MLYILPIATAILLTIYSFALIDPNITFVQHPAWVWFRDGMVYFGYYLREQSFWVYAGLVILLFFCSYFAVKNYKKINPVKYASIIGLLSVCSYPFLSHDFFNYMFDAKIFTYYHQNPYLQKALDFPADKWTRFMHWTHRTYPYGPVFLILSFIPAFLGMGKFTLSFILFKSLFIASYIVSVWLLSKLDRKWAIIFATSPLIIMEGLVSSHNDMIGLALAIAGIYFLFKKKNIWGRILLLSSFGIKYINLPSLGVTINKKYFILSSFIFQLLLLGYMSFRMEIQPWYFLALFAYLPFYSGFIEKLQLFFFGLLMSYYPYIRLGGWDTAEKVNMKHQIILFFFVLNLLYLGFDFIRHTYKVNSRKRQSHF